MREKVLIIAEAGVNHNGDLKLAEELIKEAARAGADIVKFQTFKAERLVTSKARQAAYQIENTGKVESQYAMLRRLELSDEDHRKLIEICHREGIGFLSTPFDAESVDFLASLGVRTWKIPSGDLTNYLLLRKIGKRNESVILSTGMATMNEIRESIRVLEKFGQNPQNITLLHCTTQYPAPLEDVNLLAMTEMKKEFGLPVGYSDHTAGITVPIAAVSLGAEVIEKHFTLSRELPGPDHKASLEPDELVEMIRGIRNVEQALGDGLKEPASSEKANKNVARKSIVAARAIRKGEAYTEENLTVKRPGDGISPMRWEEIIGQVAGRDYKVDEQIEG